MLASLLLFFTERGGELWDSMTLRAEVLSQSPQARFTLQYLLFNMYSLLIKDKVGEGYKIFLFISEIYNTTYHTAIVFFLNSLNNLVFKNFII